MQYPVSVSNRSVTIPPRLCCDKCETGDDRCNTHSPGVRALIRQQARDADPGAVKRNLRVDEESLETANRRQKSGNDDKPALMDPETKRRAHTLIRQFLDWQAEEKAAKEKAADDAKWAKTRKMIGATDTLPGEIPTNASQQRLKDSIARLKKRELKQVINRRQEAAGTGSRAVDIAPAKKRTQQQPASARMRPAAPFSPESFRQVATSGFSFGMTQQQINDDAKEKHNAVQRYLRGEDGPPQLGEISEADINSKNPEVSFRAQTQREGRKQREAFMRAAPLSRVEYPDAYSDLTNFNSTGKKLRGEDAAMTPERRFAIETAAMREKLERA